MLTLMLDALSSVGCKGEPTWIGPALTCLIESGLWEHGGQSNPWSSLLLVMSHVSL